MTQVAERRMAMHDLNLLPDEDMSECWKSREDRGEGRGSIYDPVGYVVYLQTVGQVSYSSSTWIWRAIGMRNDDHPVASIDQFLISNSACSTKIPRFQSILFEDNYQHLRWQRDRCGSRHLLAVGRRNPISYYAKSAAFSSAKPPTKDWLSMLKIGFGRERTRYCKASW